VNPPVSSYPVDQNPRQVKGAGQGIAVAVVNDGASTVYVDDSGAVSPSGSLPVDPGDIVQWEAGSDLWVCTGPGESGHVLITNTTGNVFRAGAIAAQLLDQGLPAAIASAISLEGVPAIDRPVTLYDATETLPHNTQVFGPLLDVSKYLSLVLSWSEVGGSTAAVRRVRLIWYADVAGTLQVGSEAITVDTAGGAFSGTVPVREAEAVRIIYTSAATVTDSSATIQVAGSYRPVQQERIRVISGRASTVTELDSGFYDGLAIAAGNINGGATLDWYPTVWAGDVVGQVRFNPTTASELRVLDLLTGQFIWSKTLAVGVTGGQDIAFHTPPRPCQVRLINSSAGVISYAIDLASLGAR